LIRLGQKRGEITVCGSHSGLAIWETALSIKKLMLIVAIFAVCFGVMELATGAVVALSVSSLVMVPWGMSWRTVEFATGIACLTYLGIVGSEIVADHIMRLFLFLICVLLGLCWLVRLGVIAGEDWEPGDPIKQRRLLDLLGLPILVAVLFVVGISGVTRIGFQVRFALSKAELEAEALRVPRKTRIRYRPDRRVGAGLLRIHSIQERDGCRIIVAGRRGFAVTEGLVYCPYSNVPKWKEYSFTHLEGPWWRFREVWV